MSEDNILNNTQVPTEGDDAVNTASELPPVPTEIYEPTTQTGPSISVAEVTGGIPKDIPQSEPRHEPTIPVSESLLKELLALKARVDTLEVGDEAIDLLKKDQQKPIVRVAFIEEGEKQYIITALKYKTTIDGQKFSTWNDGIDEMTKKDIIKIEPVLVDLSTGETITKVMRYDEFFAITRLIPLDVQETKSLPIDLTPPISKNVTVDFIEWEDGKSGTPQPRKTGQRIKLQAVGTKNIYRVGYNNEMYDISQEVINIKP